jgi:hypothetical protein
VSILLKNSGIKSTAASQKEYGPFIPNDLHLFPFLEQTSQSGGPSIGTLTS